MNEYEKERNVGGGGGCDIIIKALKILVNGMKIVGIFIFKPS